MISNTHDTKLLSILDHYTKLSFVIIPQINSFTHMPFLQSLSAAANIPINRLLDPDLKFDPTPFKEQKSTVPGFKTEYVLTDKNKENPKKIAYKLSDTHWLILDFDAYGSPIPMEEIPIFFLSYCIATH